MRVFSENMAEDNLPQRASENVHEDYLHPTPGASENTPEDYLHPLAGASESYEIPVLPDYVVPNPVYEPLRNIYERLANRFRRVIAQN
ncbi:hypothetical protein BaRGS_00023308 [Batillaria attramentaria]|uniref:Uncharacterized protein n=1 Tax=Batillaria attramentaria TaxID=370345 RepID=A0ABD0KE89_9CAEN